MHIGNVRVAYYDNMAIDTTGCQYEDLEAYGFFIDGDKVEPGQHTYKRWTRAVESEALTGVRDTMYTLKANVFEAPETILADTICEGDSYTTADFTGKDRTGVYRRKLQSVLHCDSLITLNLVVTPRSYAEDDIQTLCQGETYTWNGNVYDRAGLYYDTIPSAAGCDSVMTLVLSYHAEEDTIFDAITVSLEELPYTYENEAYPYISSQAPVYFAEGTAKGTYTDTVLVQGVNCTAVLVLTTEIYDPHEGINEIGIDERTGARKVIFRDNMYIILNDEWYNAAGQKVADPRK